MPSPNLIASILARETKRVKVAVVGNAMPVYDPPTRVAEEFAMIDVISGGRLIAGMVVGGGHEYYSFSVSPAYARERFQEAHDLTLKAWTTPGPFEWIGKHYRIRYVNPWPRPIQQPHPEIWIPGAGSIETMEFVARNHYAYMGIPYFHLDVFKRYFSMFREACESEGYEADPLQAGWLVPIYVAETDEQARREYEEHLWYFVKRLLPGITIQPPGYTSVRSLASILKSAGTFMLNVETWEQIVDGRYAIVGSPETVTEQLVDALSALGTGNLLGLFHLGSLPDHLTRKNMALFAEQVIPKLRAEFPEGKPVHPALAALAGSFAVMVPVFPGYGESEGIDQISSMEDAVFHLLDMWELLGVDAPIVVGLSLGGWMAMELATRYPDRVGKMVLVNPV